MKAFSNFDKASEDQNKTMKRLKGRSASPIDRHTLDILPGMQDFF